MNSAGSTGSGRKRYRLSSSTPVSKRKPKVDTVTARALAALADDSCSSSGDGTDASTHRDGPPSNDGSGRNDSQDRNIRASGRLTSSGINGSGERVSVRKEEGKQKSNSLASGRTSTNSDSKRKSPRADTVINGQATSAQPLTANNTSKTASSGNPQKPNGNTSSPITIDDASDDGGDELNESELKPAHKKTAPLDSSLDIIEDGYSDVVGADAVKPHRLKGQYSDVLACFTATPFDSKAMQKLHKSKESIPLKINGDDTASSLPIISQKQFIRTTKEKVAVALAEENELAALEVAALQNGANQETDARLSAAVNEFLVEEGKRLLIQSLLSEQHNRMTSLYANATAASQQYRPPQPQQEQYLLGQPTQHPSYQDLDLAYSHALQQAAVSVRQQQLQQQQMHDQYSYTRPASHSFDFTSYVQPQYTQNDAFSEYQVYLQQKQQQVLEQFRRPYQQQQLNGWQQQYATSLPTSPNVYANDAFFSAPTSLQSLPISYQAGYSAASAFHGAPIPIAPTTAATAPKISNLQPKKSPPKVKVAKASKPFKLTKTNLETVAKLPVAFAFSLKDNDTAVAKADALANANKWITEGKKAAKQMDKNRGGGGTKRPRSRTPPPPGSLEPAPELPDGWSIQTIQRNTGNGMYYYWYSPLKKYKFRSRKGALIFAEVMKEEAAKGDEEKAYILYISRGNKL
jgi:hypothetical protein